MNLIYFHICCINNWRDVVQKLFNKIHESALYDKIDEIRCVVLGKDYDDTIFQDPKIKIVYKDDDASVYEFKIMEIIYQDSQKEDFNMLYIHSKGVSHANKDQQIQANVNDWVDMMIYYLIDNHEKCLEKLQEYDAVGVNLLSVPAVHFSGNFWWSKSSHIKTLGPIVDRSYNGPEFYITSKKDGKYFSVWNSNVWHYGTPYPPEKYVGQIIENFQNSHYIHVDCYNKKIYNMLIFTSVLALISLLCMLYMIKVQKV